MKSVTTVMASAALLMAGAGTAAAQQIDERCENQARQANVAATHNVVYDEEDNVCVATLIGRPMFGAPGFVAGGGVAAGTGAAGALGAAGGVLAGVIDRKSVV